MLYEKKKNKKKHNCMHIHFSSQNIPPICQITWNRSYSLQMHFIVMFSQNVIRLLATIFFSSFPQMQLVLQPYFSLHILGSHLAPQHPALPICLNMVGILCSAENPVCYTYIFWTHV